MSNNKEVQPTGIATQTQSQGLDRRKAISRIGGGVVGAAIGLPILMSVRSLVPNALYERPLRFKVGELERFTSGPTFIPDQRVFVFREEQTFYCISASCTHLGCTVQLVRQGPNEVEFQCPCHGSKFLGDGTNYAGPAPRALDYYRLELAPDDGQLVVDMSQIADKGWRFTA